ncbi:MAG: DUF4267 domain-containing protein [Rhizomicrobium sp.]
MLANIAWWGAAIIGAGIIFIGARFLAQPIVAASGYGMPGSPQTFNGFHGWLAVKGVRDIVSGIFIFIVMANGAPHLVGWFMLAATLIPIGDAAIVLRSGGTKTAAFAIHGATALVMLAIAAALIAA